MIRAYFISDVHLGADNNESEKLREKKFLDFLSKIEKEATHVFFVGDLFDFWFEYKYTIPRRYFHVLCRLKRMTDGGIRIVYLAGNHDFWLGNFFKAELNMETADNEWTGDIAGKRFYLFHGDGVAKKDVGYRMLKKILRNRTNIRIFRWLHPDVGFPLARFVSGSSRQYTNNINLNDDSDYLEFAQQRFEEGFDYVLMGHRHNPLEHNEGDKKYINLGDWLFNFSYAVFDGKELILKNLDM